MHDVRWFGPNRFTHLVVPGLRARGLAVATEGDEPARVALAASGTVARDAYQYIRRHRAALVLYVWDLPPWRLADGAPDPVVEIGARLVRVPRVRGGFREHRGFYSRLAHIARRAAEVWVPSGLTEEAVRRHFAVEPRRVAYCFDSARFTPGDGAGAGTGPLVTISRLTTSKDQATAVRAAALLGMPLRVIGRGPQEEALRRLAREVGAAATVESGLPDEDVLAAYRTAAAVVAPSHFEGLGLTGVEAIACGTRVAASDIPPHREFLGESACFFPAGDAEAAAEAIRAALAAPRPDPARVAWLGLEPAAERFAAALARLL